MFDNKSGEKRNEGKGKGKEGEGQGGRVHLVCLERNGWKKQEK